MVAVLADCVETIPIEVDSRAYLGAERPICALAEATLNRLLDSVQVRLPECLLDPVVSTISCDLQPACVRAMVLRSDQY